MLRPSVISKEVIRIKRSHLKGTESPFYKNGIGDFIRFRNNVTVKECDRCGKDLNGVSQYEWAVHHKDHDRTNNTLDNFEVLCKRCHQLEHNCTDRLKLSYTKACFMCGSNFVSKANNAKYCESCNPIYRRFKNNRTPELIRQMITEGKV